MKNKFTYNVFFDNEAKNIQESMENVLINYIKQILNSNDCNEGSLKV